MKLLVNTFEPTSLSRTLPLLFRHKGNVNGRHVDLFTDLHECGEHKLYIVRLFGGCQQPRSCGGRERHTDLHFGIVLPAGALPGISPAIVEYVFAL